ncbi:MULTISPECIES: PP2C family protein-serine/threonine phosphatase [Streptomyces]|uniref:Serine/threonine-protein phosphatase n=1 Tax=Streptomyces anulatus TaxID=1892 RepID=A0ABZ1ZCT1_STRAQ|nr:MULTISPECIES: PP2C family protein-serine/threonine phosphatase [Streptomyces]MCX4521989.1 serine/threonine-protein phosphatase [Streptomyces anulatus]MCX4604865.1 serine/threonine-protein phosphatase [Streptomyces anulatus]WTE29689.1 serine/threonine-protein phosphatase [Streptomyces anulatus]
MRDISNGYTDASSADRTRILARALPPLLVVLGILWQAVTPQEITGTPFFTAAPLVAAPLFARWVAAFFGAVGILAAVLLHVVGGKVTQDAAAQYLTTELATIAFATVLAVLIHGVVERARNQAATARGVAEAAQRAVLPTPPTRIDGLHLAARYEAARTDTLVGGDFYAALHTPYGVRLIVGDVRGKGLGAIETVAVVLGAFWEAADSEPCLPTLADRLEKALIRGAERRRAADSSESFATCVLGEIPPGRHILRILNRGHPEPFLLDAAGGVTKLSPREFALPLGLGHLNVRACQPDQWPLPPDSTLLLYTDGLSESRDAPGDFYDPVRHLEGRIFSSPEALLASVTKDVRRHTNGARDDDMALLAITRVQ